MCVKYFRVINRFFVINRFLRSIYFGMINRFSWVIKYFYMINRFSWVIKYFYMINNFGMINRFSWVIKYFYMINNFGMINRFSWVIKYFYMINNFGMINIFLRVIEYFLCNQPIFEWSDISMIEYFSDQYILVWSIDFHEWSIIFMTINNFYVINIFLRVIEYF